MSDPTTHTQNVDLPELPDEFGKEVLARFQHRGPGETSAAAMDADVPGGLPTDLPGQQAWGQGTSVDASAQFENMAQQLARDIAAGKVDADGKPVVEAEPAESGSALPPPQAGAAPPSPTAPAEAPAGPETPDPTQTVSDGEDSTLPAPEAGTKQPAPEPGGYVWNYLDPTTNAPAATRYSDADVQQGLHLKHWADNLDPGMREAFAAIEDGQAVPIPRAEFDRYWAWQQQQQSSQRDADLSDIDADPNVIKMLQDQRNEIEQLRYQMAQGAQPTPYENVDANLTQFAQRFDQGVVAYAQQNRLTTEEAQQLVNDAVQSGIINHLAQQHSQWNPATGKLIAPADPALVAREALNWAVFRNPQFHQTLLQRQQQQTPTQAPTGQPGQAGAPAPSNVTPITAKKARASSLATAPSAAVSPAPRSVNDMSQQELVNNMAAFIDQAQVQ